MSVPSCPRSLWPCAEGSDGPLRMPSRACAASEGGSLVVSPTVVTPLFLWLPMSAKAGEHLGEMGETSSTILV